MIKELRERNFPEVMKELNIPIKRAHEVASRRMMELFANITEVSHNSQGLGLTTSCYFSYSVFCLFGFLCLLLKAYLTDTIRFITI